MLSKTSQSQKEGQILHVPKVVKLMGAGNRRVVARGWEEKEMSCRSVVHGVSVMQDEKGLEILYNIVL